MNKQPQGLPYLYPAKLSVELAKADCEAIRRRLAELKAAKELHAGMVCANLPLLVTL